MGVIIGVGLGCLEASILIVWRQATALLSDWTRAGLTLAVVGLCVVLGSHDGSALAFYLLVVLVLWRWVPLRRSRAGWERCVGSWARPAWRRWRVYDYHWQDLMEQLHFVRVRRFRPDVQPRIVSLRTSRPAGFPGSSTDTLIVRSERTVEDFALAAEDLAHVLGARSCRAYRHPRVRGVIRKHSAVKLVLGYGADPLERTVPAFPVPSCPEDVDLSAIPVGLTEHGEVWTLPLLGEHILIAGVTGSGTGSLVWSMIRGILPLIQNGCIRVWAFDPKGGVELNIGHDPHDLFYRYCDSDDLQDHADMLAEAVTAMKDQLAWLKTAPVSPDVPDVYGIRKLARPTPEHPLNLLLIDEMAQITAKQIVPDLTRQIDASMRKLVNMGRAPAFPIMGMLQNPTNDTNKHRDEFSCFVALELNGGHVRVDMILGPGMYNLGAHCDRIEHGKMAGTGYVVQSGVPEPVRVRASWVSDEDIRQMARDYAPLVPAQSD